MLLVAAVAFMTMAQAQVVVGLQGGFHQQKNTRSLNNDYNLLTNYVGALRVGYMITPKLYVGVSGGLLGSNTKDYVDTAMRPYEGMLHPVKDQNLTSSYSGWTVSPQVRYEFLKYGNMHFHLLLQGSYSSRGYTTYKEEWIWVNYPSANLPYDVDPYSDSISHSSWSVSLRPTLTYEFSKHLSAELSLDFLSIGYISETTKYDKTITTDVTTGLSSTIEPYSATQKTFYAGLNTLMETLRWESPMLRLGFNWTF